ncbi:MAG: hypothetical protein ILO34_08175 [Kiritimatiellae bacterium]|nr:hypothetical protein [Kiritimatiellia bacterium]
MKIMCMMLGVALAVTISVVAGCRILASRSTEATVKEGLAFRGSNQIERRLGTDVTAHHTEDDVVGWLNAIFPQ